MGSRPAGDSSDDSDDEFYWGDKPPRSQRYIQPIKPVELSADEKLLNACVNDDADGVRQAISDKANVHVRSQLFGNHTPIMLAASRGHLDVLKVLIENGANVKDDYEMFNVVMSLCSSMCRDEEKLVACLDTLLENGADPNAIDWVGATSLHGAVRSNHPLIVDRLLQSGCSIEVEDGDGWTPIFYAVNNKSFTMTNLLINAGANIGAIDRRGNSLMDIAMQAGASEDDELIKLLSPPDFTTNEGEIIRVENPRPVSSYRNAMLCAPQLDDRFFGFHDNALEIVRGMGLDSVAKIMERKAVQFSELMTWSDDEWKRAGVEMSYHLKKIKYSVIRYHEHEWGKGAIPNVSVVSSSGELDLFATVQLLLDCLRVCHILSTSTLFIRKNISSGELSPETLKELNETAAWAIIAKRQLRALKILAENFDEKSSRPPDLIRSGELRKKRSGLKHVFIGCFFVAAVVSFRSPIFNLVNACTSVKLTFLSRL